MDDRAFDEVWGALTRERDLMSSTVDEKRAELATAEARLASIDDVLNGLRKLDLAPASAHAEANEHEEEDDPDEVDPHASGVSGRQRIRSTDLVVDLVNGSPWPLSRAEVLAEFQARIGFPPSWSNPRNALGNALARAAKSGKIQALEGDRFASVDWKADREKVTR